jgi:type VI secretion system protein ImpK
MSDNPFAESDDPDRTVIRRPNPGGRARPAVPRAPSESAVATARPRSAPAATVPEGPSRIRTGGSPLLDAAAPLLLLMARLRNTLSQPDAGELRERAVREMRVFEQRAREAGVPLEQLRPTHYALCASLDDIVLNTPWGSSGGWDAHSLVSTFHQEVRSGERFFDLLAQMRQSPGRFLPVLEIMYLCMSLGFAGRTRLSPRGPAELDKLREETYALIARDRPTAGPELSPHWQGVAAPYRPARAMLPVWVAWSAAAAASAGLFAWALVGLNSGSDIVFNQMVAAPPAQVPLISRAAAVQPLPPQPPSTEPSALDRLRAFLKPEIDQHLVEVTGAPSTPTVRILGDGMFSPGSASLAPRFIPLLHRIGAAMAQEQGPVLVAGYTDNQPIRTLRFPSNFQLSAARAEAAKGVIAQTLGDPARITAEGRADADPIAPNTTAKGRAQNRRIEATLRRGG